MVSRMNFIFLESKNEDTILKQLEFSLRGTDVINFNGSNNENKKEKEIILNILDDVSSNPNHMMIDWYHSDIMAQWQQVIDFIHGKTKIAPKDIEFYVGITNKTTSNYCLILFKILSTNIKGQDSITIIVGSYDHIMRTQKKIARSYGLDDEE